MVTRLKEIDAVVIGMGWAGGIIDGALTRTVRDAAATLDAISAPMPGEPYYAPPLPRPLRDEVGQDPGRLRVGFIDRPGTDGYLDHPECRDGAACGRDRGRCQLPTGADRVGAVRRGTGTGRRGEVGDWRLAQGGASVWAWPVTHSVPTRAYPLSASPSSASIASSSG